MDSQTMTQLIDMIGAADAAAPRVDAVKVHVRSDSVFFHNPAQFRQPSQREIKQQLERAPAKQRLEIAADKTD